MFDTRHAVLVAILERFNEEKIEFAYPTTTNFTAAPDGTMIMPYAEVQPVKRVDLRDDERSAAPEAKPAKRRKGGGTSASG